MPNFTARTPEELALVTIDADKQMSKHMEYYKTSEGICFKGVGIVAEGFDIDTFLKVRTVTNRGGTKAYCFIWLFTSAGEPIVRSQFVASYSSEAIAGAFNKLLDGHRSCHFENGTYVAAIARLYRPDLRACRIA